MLLGALLGVEREIKDKPAGLRTHMLVCGAAVMFVALSETIISQFYHRLGSGLAAADPTRIIQAVVTGVSFLGAGTILRHRSAPQVEGLTTAASILFTAALGIAVALDQLVIAIGASLLALLTLRGVGKFEKWLAQQQSS